MRSETPEIPTIATSDGSWASGRPALPGLWGRAEPSTPINPFKNNTCEGHAGAGDADLKRKKHFLGWNWS